MKYIAEVDNEFLRKYRRHLRVGEFIHRHPRIRRIIFRIGGAFRSIEDDYERHQSKLLFHDRSSQSPPTHNEDRFGEMRWSYFIGQVGGAVKVYSAV